MGKGAIMVSCPKPLEQIFIPLTLGGLIRSMVATGQGDSEKKLFKDVDNGWTTMDNRACKPYKLP